MSAYPRPEGDTTAAAWAASPAAWPGILDCVHCGLCLDVCPTYHATGNEIDSPRGRIFLLRAVAEGRLPAAEAGAALDRCLLCRACEPACPSQVPYHRMVEAQREGRTRTAERILLRVLASRRLLGLTGRLLRAARTAGLLGLAERFAPRRLRTLAAAVPASPDRFRAEVRSHPARGGRRGRVGLHLGCVNTEFFGGVLRDAIHVLAVQGFEVVVPAQPACCGALHAHAGEARRGRCLAAATLDAFPADLDAILVPSAGCSAHLAAQDPQRSVADPLVFLAQRGVRPVWERLDLAVAVDPPCHLLHVQGVSGEPEAVLAGVPGLRVLACDEAERCCGAGGTAFVREPALCDAILDRKLAHLEAAAPDCVASGNPGCLLRLEAGLRRRGSRITAVHPLSLLARAARHGGAGPQP